MSVCHTHSRWSALFSVIKGGLRPDPHVRQISSRRWPARLSCGGLIGTFERGEALAATLKDSNAVLLRAHGDAVVGTSLEQAIQRTIQLAFLGQLAHMAVAHGEPLYMSQDELATFSSDPAFPARPWEYYLSRIRDRRSA